ncbi:flavodoxin domain-containing protein [Alteromonas sp. AMM-1]|uniref:flavodoxin domain-containing protein n=1 Tax=Alteromonas sp. AMM-1 TaxID=3394233 RepID=UPI0039A48AB9
MATVNIIVGSVYGNAESVAESVQTFLSSEGINAVVFTDASVTDITDPDGLLVITSTTGSGDIPPNLEFTFDELRTAFPLLDGKPFAVAALGDSSYGDSFCGAGRQWQELLTELQGKRIADMLEVDAMETLEPETDVIEWLKGFVNKLA